MGHCCQKKKKRAIISSILHKLEIFTVIFGFLLFFGVRFIKKMLEYSDPTAEKLELI